MGCCLFDCIGGCVLTIFRWAIFLMNIVFVISGISLITIGSIILVNVSSLDEFYEEEAEVAAIILISTGALTFLISFLGCCGAVKKSPWMMNIYGGVLFVLFAVQLAGGIVAFTYKDYFTAQFKETMTEYMEQYMVNGNGEQIATDAWDKLQNNYECCGMDSYMDWSTYRPELPSVPESCNCENASRECIPLGTGNIYGTGCYTKLEPYLRELIDAMGGLGIGTAILNLVAGVFSICLGNHFKEGRRRGSSIS